MRLTLRSLLALLDDPGLDNEVQDHLRAELRQDRHFSSIAERIDNLSSKPRMAAPKVDAMGTSDANRVAQYLDVSLPTELLARFEQTCLKNDTLLAEVASCHQIICRMHPVKREVSPKLRDRVYQIGFQESDSYSPPVELSEDRYAATPTETQQSVPTESIESQSVNPDLKICSVPDLDEPAQPVEVTEQSAEPFQLEDIEKEIKAQEEPIEKVQISLSETSKESEEEVAGGSSRGRWFVVLAIIGLWFAVWFTFPQIRQEVWSGGAGNKPEEKDVAQGEELIPGPNGLFNPITAEGDGTADNNPLPMSNADSSLTSANDNGRLPVDSLNKENVVKATDAQSSLPSTSLPSTSLPSIQAAEQSGMIPSLPGTDSKSNTQSIANSNTLTDGNGLSTGTGGSNLSSLPPTTMANDSTGGQQAKSLGPPNQSNKKESLQGILSGSSETESNLAANGLPESNSFGNTLESKNSGSAATKVPNPLPSTTSPGKGSDEGMFSALPAVDGSTESKSLTETNNNGVKTAGLSQGNGIGSSEDHSAIRKVAGSESSPFPGSALPSTALPKSPQPTSGSPFLRTTWTHNSAVVSTDGDGKRRVKVLPLGLSRVMIRSAVSGEWTATFSGGSIYEVRNKEGWKEVSPESSIVLREGLVLIRSAVKGESLRVNTPIGPVTFSNETGEAELILEVRPYSPAGVHAGIASCRYRVGCLGLRGKVVVHNKLIGERFVSVGDQVKVQVDGQVSQDYIEPSKDILKLAAWCRDGKADPTAEEFSKFLQLPNPEAQLARIVKQETTDQQSRNRKDLAATWCYAIGELDPVFDVLGDLSMAGSWNLHIDKVRRKLKTDPQAVKKLKQIMISRRVPLWIEKAFYGYQPSTMEAQDWADIIDGLYDKENRSVRVLSIKTLEILTGERFGYDPRLGIRENAEAIKVWRQWYRKEHYKAVINSSKSAAR